MKRQSWESPTAVCGGVVGSRVRKIKAFVTDFIHPEAVFMLHGFGRQVPATTRCFGKGASDTALQENVTDMIGGSPGLHDTFAEKWTSDHDFVLQKGVSDE
jgi:hypothetical protein